MFILQSLLTSGTAAGPTIGSTLYTWGFNNRGTLGNGLTTDRSSPVQIGSRSWSQIAVGTWHTLAIDSDAKLWAWGSNAANGLGTTGPNRSSPIQIGTSSWTAIGVYRGITEGYQWSAGIDALGKLYTWGNNFYFQGGQGDRNFGCFSSRF